MQTFLFGDGEIQKGRLSLSLLIIEGLEDFITLATKREQFVPFIVKGP